MKTKRLGIALSGGGARGLAHIGVLKMLENAGVSIDYISGSSMGGIIAALYASGMSPLEIETVAISKSKLSELIRLADPTALRRGLFEGYRVKSMLTDWLGEKKHFSDLNIPLAITAVDLNTSKEIVFRDGELLSALMATSAFPGIFPPVEFNGYRLVDGGVLNNLPVDRVRELGAEVILAVDVLFHTSDLAKGWRMSIPIPGFFEEFYRAEMIMQAEFSRLKLNINKPDIIISPPIPPEVGIFIGFTQAEKIIEAGGAAATMCLPLLKDLMNR